MSLNELTEEYVHGYTTLVLYTSMARVVISNTDTMIVF